MGSMLSNIAKHVTPKTLAAHGGSGIKSSMNSYDDLIAPGPDEIPSRPGSASSSEHAASSDVEPQSSLLWPYVNTSRAHNDDSESEHPLRLRRPALYEEYWADESN
jgi:hypothetical protein